MMGALDQRVKLGRSLSCGARARAPSPLGGAIVGPTVTTRDGRIEGVERDGVHVFRGIPYARAPVGPLRWRAPRPPQAWTGVRDATKAGFAAPQVPGATERIMPGPALETDEDCLTLNVWTPSTPAPPRPVMVWIHGGGFLTGAGSLPIYNGRFLAGGGDVVVVTVNYRLGALGFLAHPVLRDPESGAAGNWGLLDQIAALTWVRDNVEAFGGDPGKVTVFGESAGAMSVGTLMGTPAAAGLFLRAIMQSGSPAALPMDEAGPTAESVLHAAGCDVLEPERARALPLGALLEAQEGLWARRGMAQGLPLQPVVDGAVLERHPSEAIAAGLSAGVATISGTNRDEWEMFAMADPGAARLDDEHLQRRLSALLAAGNGRLGAEVGEVLRTYTGARAGRGQPVTPRDLWVAVQSDLVFRLPAIRLAEAQARVGAPVHAYLFTWESPAFGGALRSCHALEIPFVWGTHVYPGISTFTGAGPEVDALAARMQQAWLSFARTGEPADGVTGAWPRYDAGRRATVVLGPGGTVEEAPLDEERRAWTAAAVA
ncbi:MAG: carboxylesterase family protein [Actinobacteria bacterium]|nr:MAG: carboxylesterase family protein [Actinomycetota bacterium]